jgi:hypothetical protein
MNCRKEDDEAGRRNSIKHRCVTHLYSNALLKEIQKPKAKITSSVYFTFTFLISIIKYQV